MKTLTPYEKAKAVYDSWIFSLYVQAGIEHGEIPHCIFNEELTIKTHGKIDAKIKPSTQEEPDINGIADNLRIITMGTCFIAFDEALNEIFREKPGAYSDNDIDSLRRIIYMMRCAFAHRPALPMWCIKPKYRKIFSIKQINFVIDFSQLNGKKLIYAHHGGSQALWNLMEYCMATIKEYSTARRTNQE